MCSSRIRRPRRGLGAVVVHVVMEHVVGEIARQETGAEREVSGIAGHQVEAVDEQRGQGDAHRGGHYQPHRIVGMVVVDPVDDPMQSGADAAVGLEMEHDAVQPVLGQRPEQVAAEQVEDGQPACATDHALHEHERDRRPEQDRRHARVHARELVEQVRIEHARRGAHELAAAQPLELVGGEVAEILTLLGRHTP